MSETDLSGDTSGTYGGDIGFDDGGGNPADYGMNQSDFDFATNTGKETGGFGNNQTAQGIANYLAQPQFGLNRSNVIGMKNYDPTYAAALDISRGLNPGAVTGGLTVPSYLEPQIEGKYYSPVEKALVEMEPVGIMAMLGKGLQSLMDTAKGSFNDAKSALGLKGDAAGGLKDDDFTGMMSTRDDQLMSNMSQQGAGMSVTDPVVNTPSVNMGSIPQVSPTFDAFGNVTRDAGMSRFRDAFDQRGAGIASLLPEQNREANISVDDAVNPTSPFTDFNAKEYLDDFENSLRQRQIENNKRNRDRLLSGNKIADASTFNILQGLGTKFNPQINQILKENVNPNINFETGAKRDPFDPDKMMPYMGINIPFNIG